MCLSKQNPAACGGSIKVYLAAAYSRKPQIERYAAELRSLGIEVTSSWLEEPHAPNSQMADFAEETHLKYARADVRDINDADTFIFFSVEPTTPTVRGGRHVEFGMAVALGKRVIVVGPKENIFHHLPQVTNVPTWASAVELLQDTRVVK